MTDRLFLESIETEITLWYHGATNSFDLATLLFIESIIVLLTHLNAVLLYSGVKLSHPYLD